MALAWGVWPKKKLVLEMGALGREHQNWRWLGWEWKGVGIQGWVDGWMDGMPGILVVVAFSFLFSHTISAAWLGVAMSFPFPFLPYLSSFPRSN